MNVNITMGHVNDVFRLKQKDKALSEALDFVQHWKRDRADNQLPTESSLEHVESVLRKAIAGE